MKIYTHSQGGSESDSMKIRLMIIEVQKLMLHIFAYFTKFKFKDLKHINA